MTKQNNNPLAALSLSVTYPAPHWRMMACALIDTAEHLADQVREEADADYEEASEALYWRLRGLEALAFMLRSVEGLPEALKPNSLRKVSEYMEAAEDALREAQEARDAEAMGLDAAIASDIALAPGKD